MKHLFILITAIAISCSCSDKGTEPPNNGLDTTSRNFEWRADTLWTSDAFSIYMYDIWGSSENNVWVVGHSDDPYARIWHWDGNEWKNVKPEFDNWTGLSHRGIFGFTENDFWIVGGASRLVHPWDVHGALINNNGIEWILHNPETLPRFRSIWGSSSKNLFLGANNGYVYHYNGVALNPINTKTTSQIQAIWGINESQVYAVGVESDSTGIELEEITKYFFYITDDTVYVNSPSITHKLNTNKLCVTWTAVHNGYGYKEVYYQEYTPGSGTPQPYGNQTILYTYNQWNNPRGNPSIGYDPAGIINVFYEDSYSSLWSKKKSGSSWYTAYYSTGIHPSTVDMAPRSAAWTKYTSAPYFVKTYYPSSGMSKISSIESDSTDEKPLTVHKRFDYFLSDDTTNVEFVSLLLRSATVNEMPVVFDDENKGNVLRFSGSDDISLTFDVFDKNIDFKEKKNEKLLSIYLVADKKRTLLEEYKLSDFKKDEEKTIKSFYYSALSKKQGYLEIAFDDIQPFVVNILEESSSKDPLGKLSVTDLDVVPDNFELKQNYPNPFNPVTHIQFGIPDASQVKLDVYNTQGQRVVELMNEYKQAGSYEVVLNGIDLSAGVYFYRVQAGKYTAVKRMLLIK